METKRLRFGFKGKRQLPLFMVWREHIVNGEIVFAYVIFNSRDWCFWCRDRGQS